MARPQRKITVDGKEYTLREAAEHFGIPLNLLKVRIHRKWTMEQAVGLHTNPRATTPTPPDQPQAETDGP